MPNLLIVDDDQSNRITLAALLEDEGFEPREASSFADARRVILESPAFAVALLDQHLGDGLGGNLVPLLRERSPRCVILLMSGSLGHESVPEGLDGYITKGGDFSEVLRSIQRSIERR